MRPLTLPIEAIDAQTVLVTSTNPSGETISPKPSTPVVVNSIIALLVFGLFGAIAYKKWRAILLKQRIQLLEQLWLLESRSPFEEQK
jgi:hypothetical protein